MRELEHAIEGSLTLSRGPVIEIEHLPPAVRGIGQTASVYMEVASGGHARAPLPIRRRLRLEERAAVEEALSQAGTVAKAARLLGIPRQTLQYRMKILGIAVPKASK